MSKRKPLDSFSMDAFLAGRGGPSPASQRPLESPSEAPQGPLEGPSAAPLEQHKIWLPPGAWKALEEHFRARGLTASAGIRSWILERMEREGLSR